MGPAGLALGFMALVGSAGLCPGAHLVTEVDTGEKAPCADSGYEASLQHWVLPGCVDSPPMRHSI